MLETWFWVWAISTTHFQKPQIDLYGLLDDFKEWNCSEHYYSKPLEIVKTKKCIYIMENIGKVVTYNILIVYLVVNFKGNKIQKNTRWWG